MAPGSPANVPVHMTCAHTTYTYDLIARLLPPCWRYWALEGNLASAWALGAPGPGATQPEHALFTRLAVRSRLRGPFRARREAPRDRAGRAAGCL